MELVPVGKITKTYSLKGAVKVSFEAFFMEFVEELDVLFLEHGPDKIPYFIESITINDNQPILIKLEGVDTKEQAANISRRKIFVDKSKFPNIEEAFEEEHDWDYLIEFMAFDKTTEIGKITEVFYTTHQITVQIISAAGEEVLVPLHDDFIVEILEEEKKIKFDLPEGLLDL